MNEDRPRPARLLLALLLALPLYAGCQGFDTPFAGRDPGGYDPLVNGPPIPSGAPAPRPQPVASNTNTNAGAPKENPPPGQPGVLPGQPTGGSPAALAASGAKPATAADDVRAKGPPGATDGATGWRNVGGASGGAPLHGVEPISDTVHASGAGAGATGVTPAGGVSRVETLEQAFDVLKKTYGMSWSKLTQVSNSDEYQFECAIPHRTAANMSQYYDGRGTGALGAVRNVLDKVTQEQAGN